MLSCWKICTKHFINRSLICDVSGHWWDLIREASCLWVVSTLIFCPLLFSLINIFSAFREGMLYYSRGITVLSTPSSFSLIPFFVTNKKRRKKGLMMLLLLTRNLPLSHEKQVAWWFKTQSDIWRFEVEKGLNFVLTWVLPLHSIKQAMGSFYAFGQELRTSGRVCNVSMLRD